MSLRLLAPLVGVIGALVKRRLARVTDRILVRVAGAEAAIWPVCGASAAVSDLTACLACAAGDGSANGLAGLSGDRLTVWVVSETGQRANKRS